MRLLKIVFYIWFTLLVGLLCLTFSVNCSHCFWYSNCSKFGQWAFLQAGSHVLLKGPRFFGYFQTLLPQDVPSAPSHYQLLTWHKPFLQGALGPFSGE